MNLRKKHYFCTIKPLTLLRKFGLKKRLVCGIIENGKTMKVIRSSKSNQYYQYGNNHHWTRL